MEQQDVEEEELHDGQAEEQEKMAQVQAHRKLGGLLVPMFSGLKDEFGRETVPPVPLPLGDVGEGRLPRSKALFFTTPSEVLVKIVQSLDPSSLASFALVNWDCLQLARTRLFVSTLLDYSDSSISLITKLIAEGDERLRSPTASTSRPSIGACIRRIKVATDGELMSERHGIDIEQDPNSEDVNAVRRRKNGIVKAAGDYFGSYLPSLGNILTRPEILPNLDVLDWEDKIVIPRPLFEGLSCTFIKHLKLCRVMIDEEFSFKLPNELSSGGWPLKTLHLEVIWNLFCDGREGSTASFCTSILRLCAPTLLSLTWLDMINPGTLHSLVGDSEDKLQFPRLRELRLGGVQFSDSASLAALLGKNLVTLIANTEKSDIHKQCFENRGTIHHLETFVWEAVKVPVDHPLDFLRANQQLSQLRISSPMPTLLLETRLLPLLSSSFKNLCSLSLVWGGDGIPTSALKIVSTLQSLEQIHLSAGEQFGWKHDWEINHKSLRRRLRSLPNLRKLAFSRDSYDDGSHSGDVSRYYGDQFYDWNSVILLDGEDVDTEESQNAVWERLHKERMLRHARKYIAAFPKLEWLYIGQLPMSVGESPTSNSSRYAVPLWPKRDDLWTQLGNMFGGSSFV